MKKPTLLTTLGFPGSGKTFFSRRFATEHNFFHLNSDIFRHTMFPNPEFTIKENGSVFRTMDLLAEELLKMGVNVLYDSNLTKREYRRRLERIAKKYKARYTLLWFKIPAETAIQRLSKRNKLKSRELQRYHRPVENKVLFAIKEQEELPKKESYVIVPPLSYKEQRILVVNYLKNKKSRDE